MWLDIGNDLINGNFIKTSCKNVAKVDGSDTEFRIEIMLGDHIGGGIYSYTWDSVEVRDGVYEKIKSHLLDNKEN